MIKKEAHIRRLLKVCEHLKTLIFMQKNNFLNLYYHIFFLINIDSVINLNILDISDRFNH